MEQFYWKPTRQDLLAILLQMYKVCFMRQFFKFRQQYGLQGS